MNKDNLYLVFVERLNDIPNSQGLYEYDFFFSETPEVVWGVDWNQQCPSACDIENLRPDSSTYHEIKKLYSIILLNTMADNSCFSLQDCVDGIVSLTHESIEGLEEYPTPIRLIFNYGETIESVEDKLAQRHQFFVGENKEEKNEEM